MMEEHYYYTGRYIFLQHYFFFIFVAFEALKICARYFLECSLGSLMSLENHRLGGSIEWNVAIWFVGRWFSFFPSNLFSCSFLVCLPVCLNSLEAIKEKLHNIIFNLIFNLNILYNISKYAGITSDFCRESIKFI